MGCGDGGDNSRCKTRSVLWSEVYFSDIRGNVQLSFHIHVWEMVLGLKGSSGIL